MRPRMRLGLYSEVSVSATGTSQPRPKFERKRKTESDSTFQDAATSPVNSEKSQASNITPRKQRVNRFLCQLENGRRSRRPTSSADLLSTADTDMDFPLAPRFLCAAQARADARGEAPLASS